MRAAALALALIASPLAAQEGPQLALPAAEAVEVESRSDLNGDGLPDLAYIARGQDKRELRVMTSYRSETDFGENPAQVLALDPYPLGDTTLTIKNKVLLLSDLTGGTTAVASTHLFRWDTKLGAMRLIGLDATLYSRTYAHDGRRASWNLMTGILVTSTLKLNSGPGDAAAYAKVGENRRKKPSKPLRLEGAPSGSDLLGWPGGK